MRVEVAFEDEAVILDIPEKRLIVAWHGPEGLVTRAGEDLVAKALENPRGFPALRQAIVPGDLVVIVLGTEVPRPAFVLESIGRVLKSAGVEPETVIVLADPDSPVSLKNAIPPGMTFAVHDPDDKEQLAYLATTTNGRRVYLNRRLTDADFVLPVSRLAFDPIGGVRGPWDVVFPGLSDNESRLAVQAAPLTTAQGESTEVSWLLGCQFQVGIVPGKRGIFDAIAGAGEDVRLEGEAQVEAHWTVRAGSRAELVIVGVGSPGRRSGTADLARGLATATKLVQRGGKIVVFSRMEGPLGTAFQRLNGIDDARQGIARLKGHDSDPDHHAAKQLVDSLAWADVYLLSTLEQDVVEALSMIPLERPEEANRLAAVANSCITVSRADRVKVVVQDD